MYVYGVCISVCGVFLWCACVYVDMLSVCCVWGVFVLGVFVFYLCVLGLFCLYVC